MLGNNIKLLVGLGNPGVEYQKTRHNVGFMVLEEISKKNNCSFRESKKLFGRTCAYGSGIEQTRLLMPNTYMIQDLQDGQVVWKSSTFVEKFNFCGSVQFLRKD